MAGPKSGFGEGVGGLGLLPTRGPDPRQSRLVRAAVRDRLPEADRINLGVGSLLGYRGTAAYQGSEHAKGVRYCEGTPQGYERAIDGYSCLPFGVKGVNG